MQKIDGHTVRSLGQRAFSFVKQHSHGALMILFMIAYFVCFNALDERSVDVTYNLISCPIDQYIPFCEYFVIPYLLWFFYVAVTATYLLFKDMDAFDKDAIFLVVGMTVFLIISALHPNTIDIRPTSFAHQNIFTGIIASLYATDPAICVFPSIHVFNAVSTCLAINHSKALANKKWVKIGSNVLCILIVLSTVFIKQHSVIDVVGALALAAVCYGVIYGLDAVKVAKRKREGAASRINDKL